MSLMDRVESKSNIADGPTKNRLDNLIALNAKEVTPAVSLL